MSKNFAGRNFLPLRSIRNFPPSENLLPKPKTIIFLIQKLPTAFAPSKVCRREVRRTGNWLTREEAQMWLNAPDVKTLKGMRDRAILSVLIGCGLRRAEAAILSVHHIQQREGRWAIVDIVGKRDKNRTVPMPSWAKSAIDAWTYSAHIEEGFIFRRVNKGDNLMGEESDRTGDL